MRDPPLCYMYQLQDGTYDINDLADFHEMMDEEAEYKARIEAKEKPR